VLVSSIARAVLVWLLAFALAIVLVVVTNASASVSGPTPVPTSFYPLAAIAVALVVVIVLRWCAADAAILLEEAGPMEALGRSRELTRRNTIRIILVYIAIVAIVGPLSLGSSFLVVVIGVPVIAVALSIAAGIVTFPLLSITAATIFGDLTGRPIATSTATRGASVRWRAAFAVVWGVLGIASLAFALPRYGGVAAQTFLDRVPAADHGRIYAGTNRGVDPCHPLGAKAIFSTSEPIVIGGYFTRIVPNGQSADVAFSVNGLELASAPLVSNGSLGCYYELNPLVGARTGTYHISVTLQGETIAEGEFTVR
jgi:hypothetical protein